MHRLSTILLFLIMVSTLSAQGPPITTGTPVMLGLEGNGIRTFGKYISTEKAKVYVQPIGIPYNVTAKFQIGTILPFKVIKPNEQAAVKGLSDIAIFAKYQLYKKDGTAKTFRILANIKQTFPTAKTTTTPQLGTGLFQTYLGLIFGSISSKVGLYGDLGINIPSRDAAKKLIYNLSIGLPLLPQQYPQKQLNLYLEMNGNYIPAADAHTLFLSPGLQLIPGRRVLFEASYQYPIIQSDNILNKTNYRFVLGTRFLIN